MQAGVATMNLPQILIVSTEPGKADEIATSIGGEVLSIEDDLKYYVWKIKNKYYTAQVVLCATENPTTDLSIESIDALIVHHNPQAENADHNLEQWSPLITSLAESEILLFSCNLITDELLHDKVVKWCLKRKFEFVQLSKPETESDESEDDSEDNKYGIERMIEALHAHTWPNMTLKAKPHTVEEGSPELIANDTDVEKLKMSEDFSEQFQMETVLVEDLFSRLVSLREDTTFLPTYQRRLAAEQLVTLFWNAICNDASELEDDNS